MSITAVDLKTQTVEIKCPLHKKNASFYYLLKMYSLLLLSQNVFIWINGPVH